MCQQRFLCPANGRTSCLCYVIVARTPVRRKTYTRKTKTNIMTQFNGKFAADNSGRNDIDRPNERIAAALIKPSLILIRCRDKGGGCARVCVGSILGIVLIFYVLIMEAIGLRLLVFRVICEVVVLGVVLDVREMFDRFAVIELVEFIGDIIFELIIICLI